MVEAAVEKKGIKEVTEILEALKVLATFAGNVSKDGKIGPADLAYIIELGAHFPAFAAAGMDADKALEELKDLDESEVIALVSEMYAVAKAFSEAKK